MKPTALIFSPITMGYGSPQFLYMYDTLEKLGLNVILFEKFEHNRRFQAIEKYQRYLFKYDFFSLCKFSLHILFFIKFTDIKVIVYGEDFLLPFYWLIKPHTKLIRYYLEVEENYDWKARKYFDDSNESLREKNIFNTSKITIKQLVVNLFKQPRNYDILIAPEKNRLEIAKNKYPNTANHLVVYNSPPIQKEEKVVRSLKTKKPVVLYQGQINWYTMADELFETISHSHQEFNYVLAGPCDEQYRSSLNELIAQKWVTYHGWLKRDELNDLRNSAHIGLVLWKSVNLATRFACPNKLYEYIADGLPVVFTPNESLENYHKVYKIGEMMNDFSSNSLLNSLRKIVSSPEIYRQISARNLNNYQSELNWDYQTQSLLNLLKQKYENNKPNKISS